MDIFSKDWEMMTGLEKFLYFIVAYFGPIFAFAAIVAVLYFLSGILGDPPFEASSDMYYR